jgi:hypothetical protein
MTEIVYTGLVTAEEMEQVVAHCHFSQDALFMAEQLPTHLINKQERLDLLRFIHYKSDLSCAKYTSGRIFQEDRELRWEKQGEKLRVVYVGAAKSEAELRDDHLRPNTVLSTLEKKLAYYYLFGERLRRNDLDKMGKSVQEGDFAVVRIPRILRYPVAKNNKRYARLIVCEYREPETDRVALFRFHNVEAWNGEA